MSRLLARALGALDPLANTDRYFWTLATLAAIILLAPIRKGDLAGYDDARYALVAKHIAVSGNWLEIESNGGPALEHPPLFSWMQAALFIPFGLSDPLAKLPSALCGLGVILLTAWLGRRITGSPLAGITAMFVMATSVYFIKYAARAMTDVPFTFFFLAGACCWFLAADEDAGDPRWFLAAGAFAAMAQLTRALAGFSLPLFFAADWIVNRRRVPMRYLVGGALIAFVPPIAWYAQWIARYGHEFFRLSSLYMNQEVTGELSPSWRRYTGAIEYVWMVSKSYWPWLPAMVAGIVFVVRNKDRKMRMLIPWIAVVYVLCAITKSRVLRYMLPAYPGFAILSAIGLLWLLPERYLRNGLRVLTPPLAVLVLVIAIRPPVAVHAVDTHPIALAATAATPPGERITFYDEGAPRWDEMNEMLWYGNRYFNWVWDRNLLPAALEQPQTRVFILDLNTYHAQVEGRIPHQVIARAGHLICFRLVNSQPVLARTIATAL
ncbi:MAG TPA: glycosyltransferase family 39 protein [Bryobacteraceae bacterium]|nr:glycosyltransferase family 39 protein [Bryobacteraceae bacterium]